MGKRRAEAFHTPGCAALVSQAQGLMRVSILLCGCLSGGLTSSLAAVTEGDGGRRPEGPWVSGGVDYR